MVKTLLRKIPLVISLICNNIELNYQEKYLKLARRHYEEAVQSFINQVYQPKHYNTSMDITTGI